MTTRLEVYKAYSSIRFNTQAAAIEAAMGIDPTGPTQRVYLERSESKFIKTLILHAVQVWSMNDSPFYMFAPADNAYNIKARDKLTRDPEPVTDAGKLATLMDAWGCEDENELVARALVDSVAPGICMNLECDYTTDVEPDQNAGRCEPCGTNTVKSTLELIGV